MLRHRSQTDYQPVTRTQKRGRKPAALAKSDHNSFAGAGDMNPISASSINWKVKIANPKAVAKTLLKRGHGFTYAALFVFTIILYARPAEFYPSSLTASIAFIAGVITLAFFIPTQLSLDGNLTARPREVNLVLLFALTGLLSIPLAISPSEAWHEFSNAFIRCIVIFVVIVNATRTEMRLKGLLFLTLVTGVCLSIGAINDYRLGLLTVEGYRVAGRGSGIFGNSNDMALFLVTIVPIAIAFLVGSRGLGGKMLFGSSALLMIAAVVLTYSRGGFLGLMTSLGFLAWKLGKAHRAQIFIGGFLLLAAFLLLAPGGYHLRLISLVVPSLDPVGSAEARRGELMRSLYVALRHPLLGIGMGNYAPEMSYHGLVTHNSYTQVAAEMGMAALYCYTMFIVTPFKKLGQIVRETFDEQSNSWFYYLSIGLQASLLGYMVSSFFASVAYLWYVFYLVGYAVCLRRLYESETGREVVFKKGLAQNKTQASATRGSKPEAQGRLIALSTISNR